MENLEATQIEQLPRFIKDAAIPLNVNRGDRIDNLTDKAHPDHYAHELLVDIRSDIALGRVGKAKDTIDFWLANATEEGRVPHMMPHVSGIRRTLVDRHVVRASKNDNGEWITPTSAMPVMSISALLVAEAMSDEERAKWSNGIMPKLTSIKEWQYRERDFDGDGLLSQIHPDETFFRNGKANEKVLQDLPANNKNYRLTRLHERIKKSKIISEEFINNRVNAVRKRKATSKVFNDRKSSYDARQFMSVSTGARIWDVYHKAFGDFRIKDVSANALFVADNDAYQQIAEYADTEMPEYLKSKMVNTKSSFQKFWDVEAQEFASLDREGNSLAEYSGPEKFLALIGRSAMSDIQVIKVVDKIRELAEGHNFPLPTGGEPEKAQRGAMHPMINMLVFMALDKSNERESEVRSRIGLSVYRAYINSAAYGDKASRFSQGYNPNTGESIGADYWGPTAAAGLVMASDILEQANR